MTMVWSPDYAPVDGDFDNVSLLLKGEGTNGSTTILDSSSNSLSVTAVDNAQIINTVATPFSPTVPSDGVLAFDGTGDYLTVPVNSNFQFGIGDFTVEAWVYITSASTYHSILDSRTSASFSNYAFGIYNVGGILRLDVISSGGPANRLATTTSVPLNTWTHVAWAGSNGIISYYVNGIKDATTKNYSGNFDPVSTTNLLIGALVDQLFFNGYISNLRVTKGVARYTENFDVPTAPFPILSPSGRITIADDSLDTDARQYIINVEEQDGQALEPAVRTAINNFVVGCKSDGIWNAIKASCLLSGARTLEGALVPLKGSAPTNNGPFIASDYDRKIGLKGNASTKYLDSNRANNADLQNDNHNAVYSLDLGTGGSLIGANTNNAAGAGSNYIGTNGFTRNRSNTGAFSPISVTTGLLATSRSLSTKYILRVSGQNNEILTSSDGTIPDNILIFRRPYPASPQYTDARLAFYSIGSNLDLAKLDTRISDFITAIGAAI